MTPDEIAELRRVVSVKPLAWKGDHGVAMLGPYRLFEAETPLGRYVYGTDAEGVSYYHSHSSGIQTVGDEAKAKQLAEAAWEKAALSEIGKYASRALPAAADDLEKAAGRIVAEVLDDRTGVLEAIETVVKFASRIRDQAKREAYEKCIAALKKEREAFLSEEYAYPQPMGSFSERFACDRCIEAVEALAEANS